MRVSWLLQSEVEVPVDDGWLTASEQAIVGGLRVAKRRRDWRLGRWVAKSALAALLADRDPPCSPSRLAILAASDGSPTVRLDDRTLPLPISLSHSAGLALCVVGSSGAVVGCDLELIEPHSDRFVADYFTPSERELLAAAPANTRPRMTTLLWSAKESALKALRLGLSADTRSVEVAALDSDSAARAWRALEVQRAATDEIFSGWWCSRGAHVLTVVAAPAADDPPSPLTPPWPR